MTHEIWKCLEYPGLSIDAKWPKVDKTALVTEEIEMVVQVNGKLRGKIMVPVKAPQSQIEKTAQACENVKKFIVKKDVKKIIIVPNKLVNIVVV